VVIYVIAAVVVVLFLIGAYRMMGASATVEEDPHAVLIAVLDTGSIAATALEAGPVSGDDATTPHALRRALEGCSQALERIAGIPVDLALDQARSALELAVDELSWSARLAESAAYARDDALREAGVALRGSGSANLERARSALGR
jgi:hypothetical protein